MVHLGLTHLCHHKYIVKNQMAECPLTAARWGIKMTYELQLPTDLAPYFLQKAEIL